MRKRRHERLAVTSRSLALFRLGEVCNNNCPMCSNSGRPAGWYPATEDLLRRLDFVASQGFGRLILTGGEPTIHRGFWAVVARLRELDLTWDINTHGRSFADPDFTERALNEGLERAIVSLHAHLAPISCEIAGFEPRQHEETVAGIDQLVQGGAEVMLNCVLCRPNLDHLLDHMDWCVARWGRELKLKFAFPNTIGRGGGWPGIQLRYGEVAPVVRALRRRALASQVVVVFESIPNCILGDPEAGDLGRSGFGETHYLDDLRGDRLYSMAYIESQLSVYAESCRGCEALARCPGVAQDYARRYGVDELRPMIPR